MPFRSPDAKNHQRNHLSGTVLSMRRILLLPVILGLLVVAFSSNAGAIDSSWQVEESPRLNVGIAKANGKFYVVRVAKTRCGQTVQLRVNNRNRWGKWQKIACQKANSKFSAPAVTVDQSNKRVFVVWTQASAVNEKFSFTAYRVSVNGGRTWKPAQILADYNVRVPAAVAAAADRGVLWVMRQEPEGLTDQRPRFTLTPYKEISGKPIRSSIVNRSRIYASDFSNGRALKLFASKGTVSAFWTLTDIGGATRWYAANSSSYNSPGSAKRVRVKFKGAFEPGSEQTFYQGDNGKVYRTFEYLCLVCQTTTIFTEAWSLQSNQFENSGVLTIPMLPTLGRSTVAFGANKQGQTFLAYQDSTEAEKTVVGGTEADDCEALYQGLHWCVRSIAPGPAAPSIYIQSFSPTGELVGLKQPFIYPFSGQAVPGSDVQEWVGGPTGIETMTSFLSGRPQLIFEAGHEDVSASGGIGSSIKLNVVVSDPFSF